MFAAAISQGNCVDIGLFNKNELKIEFNLSMNIIFPCQQCWQSVQVFPFKAFLKWKESFYCSVFINLHAQESVCIDGWNKILLYK